MRAEHAEQVASVLSIAGSDSSGGAGIQADIKTITAMGLYAQTAITALTAQNTTGVYGVDKVDPAFVEKQIDVVFDDIRPDSVKIGMVPSAACVHAIASSLRKNHAKRIVLDPVMVATSGSSLASDSSVIAMVDELLPISDIVTPNIHEAEVLSGMAIACEDDMVQAARIIQERAGARCRDDQQPSTSTHSTAILIKGGHFDDVVEDLAGLIATANDFLITADSQEVWLEGARIDNPNSHGTGCTLSSAIACGLASGQAVDEACIDAKRFISGALAAKLDIGKGSGPLDHMWSHGGYIRV